MFCEYCKYTGSCQLQEIAPDITGCTGHSEHKIEPKINTDETVINEFVKSCYNKKVNDLNDFSVGDVVKVLCTTLGTRLPRYIEGAPLTVIGFTKTKVKCDYDGGKPFHIPPAILRKIEPNND